ncbi:hypothetical protein ACHHYP_20453 [Achlya hypogyna]|uniref:RING-type domain-containing protein n=1 Tax=Achlya hypogyna TaxID=1202772 RepID=A0A1V9ZJ26_ACHHY|nr:hypothetical protein ACHHYP_20453 [Achlya hypogyna]
MTSTENAVAQRQGTKRAVTDSSTEDTEDDEAHELLQAAKRARVCDAARAKRRRAQQQRAQRPFRCPVCLETLSGTILECGECAHVFCEACLRECLKRQQRCPMCRRDPAPLRRNRPVERLVASLPEACPFLDMGCWAVLTRATASAHALACDFASFTCAYCTHDGRRRDHNDHACPGHEPSLPPSTTPAHLTDPPAQNTVL